MIMKVTLNDEFRLLINILLKQGSMKRENAIRYSIDYMHNLLNLALQGLKCIPGPF